MIPDDLIASGDDFTQALALRPRELPTLHRGVLEVDLVFVFDCLFKKVGVLVGESNPLVLSLEEAKEASRPSTPGVVGG